MKNVNTIRIVAYLSAGLVLATGCAAPKPGQLPVTERDRAVYTDRGAIARENNGQKFRVAILVRGDKTDQGGKISEALDSALTSALGDFPFFELVERANLDVLAKEEQLENLSGNTRGNFEIPTADFLIAAKPNTIRLQAKESTAGQLGLQKMAVPGTGGMLRMPGAGTEVEASMSVDFRFYHKATKKMLLSKNIDKSLTAADKAEAAKKLEETAQECAKAFAQELGARYAPPARVVEMRGGGRMARVSMGSNYGLVPGVKVEFYEYADHSDIIEGAEREPSPVGYGIVTEGDVKTSWVEVTDYEDYQVMRGHYARIASDQSKGFREKLGGYLK